MDSGANYRLSGKLSNANWSITGQKKRRVIISVICQDQVWERAAKCYHGKCQSAMVGQPARSRNQTATSVVRLASERSEQKHGDQSWSIVRSYPVMPVNVCIRTQVIAAKSPTEDTSPFVARFCAPNGRASNAEAIMPYSGGASHTKTCHSIFTCRMKPFSSRQTKSLLEGGPSVQHLCECTIREGDAFQVLFLLVFVNKTWSSKQSGLPAKMRLICKGMGRRQPFKLLHLEQREIWR